MTKQLRIVFSNGQIYEIPALLIASSRATYYAGVDCGKDKTLKFEDVFKKELKYSIEDDGELLDWASNNMNWSDVEAMAKLVGDQDRVVDYQDEWINSESREIIDN